VPDGSVQCTITPADDLVAAHLGVDLRINASTQEIVLLERMDRETGLDDVPINASTQEIVLLERMDRVRVLPACVKRVKLIGHEAGGERLLGEYTFVDTPSGHP